MLRVKWSELVARWSSTVASARRIFEKARSMVLPWAFVGALIGLRRSKSFSAAHSAMMPPWPREGPICHV